MDVPTDPTKEEVSHDAATARFPEIPSPLPSFDAATAVKLHKAKEEDEMGANIATRCSLCAVALGPASEKGGQPAEVHMERGVINLHHCVLCEDTSLLLKEATDAQRSLAMRDRDSWLMTTGKFTELQGKFHRAPTVMELLVEVTSNLVGAAAAARGQVKEEPPSMESAATAQGDGKELASAATAKGDAEHPSSSREGTKTFRSFWSQIKEEDALLFQEASQKKDGDSPKRKAMEMLQEQPGHKEEEARSDVDDGDDCPSSDEFLIAASSATGQMPAGNLFRSVARIRNTANGYVHGMQSVGWYGSF